MEGGKKSGEGSSRGKRHAERWSFRRRAEAPLAEEVAMDIEAAEEEEVEVPVIDVEEARKRKAKAMKSRERIEEMGFREIFRIGRMRADPALTQALRSMWDAEATAFVFPWGHMIPSLENVSRITGLRVYGRPVSGFTYPCYHDLAERLLELPVERRSSLVPRVALQESLVVFEAGKKAGETEDEHFERLVRIIRRELASEPGAEADLDLRHFLVLFLGRLLFATRGDAVHCRFLPLLDDLAERSLGLRQSAVEFPVWDRFRRPGRSFRGLHDTTYWRERAKEQISDWERKGKAVDVAGEVASLRALLYSAMQDREAAQRVSEEHRSRRCFLFTSGRELSIASGGSTSRSGAAGRGSTEAPRGAERDLRLTTEHTMELQGQRDQL
ncbi:hypothetical protein Taro_039121 [Colocasia esculenta]|uniref:Aminotransferase-like plant mobile domain-containing protein n=1 Tax=Colocasia esculenta TaxID=4460 RepID=A0A843WL94_COLES|nr:hypothetical protein [Colocasia esculenta]